MMGIGVMPNEDSYIWACWEPMVKPHANYAVHECDVLVLVGGQSGRPCGCEALQA